MATPTRMVELDVINSMIGMLGIAPVNSLVPPLTGDIIIARRVLNRQLKKFQAKGWFFNEEFDVELPLSGGEIVIPSDVVRIDTVLGGDDLVERNGKLYDKANNTFTLTSSVKVDLTRYIPFDHMPEEAKFYVETMAMRQYQDENLSSGILAPVSEREVTEAEAAWQRHQMEVEDKGLLSHSRSQIVRDIINREDGR